MTFYLYINGSYKNQETYNISLGSLTVGYSGPWEFSFTQHKKFDQKSFDFEDTVRLETHYPTIIRFEGNIKQIQCTGGTSENIRYTCQGLKKRLEEVILEKDNDMLVVYNKDGDTAPDQVGTTIKDGLDTMNTEIQQRISGFGYTSSQLNAMTVKIPADSACTAMNMMTFVETFLNYQPTYRCYVDPHTKKINYIDMDNLSVLSINVAADGNKSFNVKPDVSGCYTKVKLQGPHYIERVDFYDPQNIGGSTLARDSATQFHSKAITSGIIAGRYDPSEDEYHHGLFSLRPRFCRLYKWNNAPILYDGEISESGVITFDSSSVDPTSGYVLLVRYTYRTTPIEAESSWSGTAYSKGVKKILAEYIQDCKKLELKGKVTYLPGGGNLFFYDATMWLPTCGGADNDPLELYGKNITVGSQQKTITSYTESRIYLNSVSGISAGNDYSVASRDEVSDLQGLRDEVKDLYKNVQYIESIVLSSLNFDYCLGKKVRLTNSSDSDFLTYAPIVKVVYDLAGENTTINLTQDTKLQLNEAMRRLLAKRKKEQENKETKDKTEQVINFYTNPE